MSADPYSVTAMSRTRHPIHYHEDGNFIFVARNVEFRIYKGLLARRSQIFDDMFLIPQSDASQSPTPQPLDAVPIVDLHDVPDQFALLLDFLMPGTEPPTIRSVDQAVGLYAICDKYFIIDIRGQALAWMDGYLPSTLESYMQKRVTYSSPSDAARVIRFATDSTFPRHLPWAYYTLATHQWSARREGEQWMEEIQHAEYIESNLLTKEKHNITLLKQSLQLECMETSRLLIDLHFRGLPNCLTGGCFRKFRLPLTEFGDDYGRYPLESLYKLAGTVQSPPPCANCKSGWVQLWKQRCERVVTDVIPKALGLS